MLFGRFLKDKVVNGGPFDVLAPRHRSAAEVCFGAPIWPWGKLVVGLLVVEGGDTESCLLCGCSIGMVLDQFFVLFN